MTKTEFAQVLAYIGAGVGKEVGHMQAEVYYDLLGDLPLPVFWSAARRALLEIRYPVIPTPAELRELALDAMLPRPMLPAEAWRVAVNASGLLSATGDYKNGQKLADVQAQARQAIPEDVRRVGEAIGWKTIASSTNQDTTRAHFLKAYESLAGRAHRDALLTPALKNQPMRALPAQ